MQVLKPGQSGKGILIEYDAGYISPTEARNANLIRESDKMLDHSKPFEFYAVLQKYNTPNRNGRIYPEKILKREAENYKKMIAKGTAVSATNPLYTMTCLINNTTDINGATLDVISDNSSSPRGRTADFLWIDEIRGTV